MPLYEYQCGACQRIFEAYKRPSEDGEAASCPSCGAEAAKVGISLFRTAGSGGRTGSGSPVCGNSPRRSPFS